MKIMVVAVTGANGHLGNNLCRILLQRGFRVRALIHKNDNALSGLNLVKVEGSLFDKNSLEKLVKNVDFVIHTAAIISIGNKNKNKVFRVNVDGTQKLVEVCKKYPPKRFIYFSSIQALDLTVSGGVADEHIPLALNSRSDYNRSKAKAEKIVLEAIKNSFFEGIILNPVSIVGPNDFEPSPMGKMIVNVAQGRLPFIVKGGYYWVDVRDVANAAINAFTQGKNGERYILSGEWWSLKQLTVFVSEITNSKPPATIPLFFAIIGLPFIFLYNKIMNRTQLYTKMSLKIITGEKKDISTQKAVKELDFKARNIKHTFKDTTLWFIKNGFV